MALGPKAILASPKHSLKAGKAPASQLHAGSFTEAMKEAIMGTLPSPSSLILRCLLILKSQRHGNAATSLACVVQNKVLTEGLIFKEPKTLDTPAALGEQKNIPMTVNSSLSSEICSWQIKLCQKKLVPL